MNGLCIYIFFYSTPATSFLPSLRSNSRLREGAASVGLLPRDQPSGFHPSSSFARAKNSSVDIYTKTQAARSFFTPKYRQKKLPRRYTGI